MSFLRSNTLRLKSCAFLEQTILNQGQRVALVLVERLAPLAAAGAVVPDFWALQLFFLEVLRTLRGRVEDTERSHVDELADDAEPRSRRDSADSTLRSRMTELKSFFIGVYKPESVEALGFPRVLGRTPEELLRQVDHLLGHLRAADLVLPAPIVGEVSLPLADIATSLQPLADDLRTALTDVGREVKEANLTQLDRNRAVEEYDKAFLGIARTLETLYRLAGESELADQVRPSVRRPGRTATVVAQDGDVGSEAETAPSEQSSETSA